MRVRQTESLIDLRVDPQFGALPQAHAGKERHVRGLAALAAAGRLLAPLIGRSDCRIALPNECGLTVKVDVVQIRRGRRLGDHGQRVRRQRIVAELIVHAGAHLLQRKIGIEPLGAGEERRAAVAVVGEQIFEPRRPVWRNGRLDAGAGRQAQSPQKRRFGRAGAQLRQCQLVVGPGKSAGRVEQPAAGRVTDAAAHGAGSQHGLAECFRAERRRSQIRRAADGDAGEIWKARERCIDLGADDDAVRQHVIVTGLQSGEEASRLAEGVNRLRQAERAGDVRCPGRARGPIRTSPRVAQMAAGVESVPVVARRDR